MNKREELKRRWREGGKTLYETYKKNIQPYTELKESKLEEVNGWFSKAIEHDLAIYTVEWQKLFEKYQRDLEALEVAEDLQALEKDLKKDLEEDE